MSHLRDWLDRTGMSGAQLAKVVGVSRTTINRALTETRPPSFRLAYRISKATGGQVAIEDLIPLDEPYSIRVRFRATDPVLSDEEVQRRALRLAAAAADGAAA